MKPLLLILLLFVACPSSDLFAADATGDQYEQRILDTIRNIQSLDYDKALSSSKNLITRYPHSRLGQMLYADLIMAKTGALKTIGSGIHKDRAQHDFREEIQRRWQQNNSPAYRGMIPAQILFVANNQPYVIVVDQQNSRLYVYRHEQGSLALEADYFITIGLKGFGKEKRGDQKTPIGIYHVTRYIDGEELPDLYGQGAFPISYPNVWDRRNNRTGGGIWIHGSPSYTYNRSPRASNGCIAVSNPDLIDIGKYISPDLHTPVVVTRQIEWIESGAWQERRKQALQLLTAWLRDWESLDQERYASHYSRTGLDAFGRDFKHWESHKRWIKRNKTYIKVEFRDLNVYRYPGEDNLLLMQFQQSYRSNNLDIDTQKEVFWQHRNSQWEIVYEGTRRFPVPDNTIVEN